MACNDNLANVLSMLNNAEKVGRESITVRPASKVIKKVLEILKKEKYIKDFKIIEDLRGGSISIKLSNQINRVGVIKPNFSTSLMNMEKFEKRYLPAKNFGRIILSTSKGILTHPEARDKKVGGVLLAYVY